MLPGAAPPSRDLEPAAVGFDEPIDVSPLQSAAKVNDDDDDDDGDGDDDDDDDDDNNNVTKCIVCVQGHDLLTFLSCRPFSFLTGWEFYGPNYLKC